MWCGFSPPEHCVYSRGPFIVSRPHGTSEASVQGKSIRILVVNDDEGTRAYIAKVLSLKGWKVDTAGDGVACLALVRKQAYDAVVLDYRMPGMNGAEVCRRVCEIQPGIRPIFLTGFPTIDTVYPAIEGGADRVLAKSADLQELIGVLEEETGRTEPHASRARAG